VFEVDTIAEKLAAHGAQAIVHGMVAGWRR
jgi:hypothetical protein